ncbi:MAG: S41 family peptidase [Fibrobacterales bacterium]
MVNILFLLLIAILSSCIFDSTTSESGTVSNTPTESSYWRVTVMGTGDDAMVLDSSLGLQIYFSLTNDQIVYIQKQYDIYTLDSLAIIPNDSGYAYSDGYTVISNVDQELHMVEHDTVNQSMDEIRAVALSEAEFSLYKGKRLYNDEVSLNKNIYDAMQYYYLWYDSIPDVNPENFTTPYALVENITDNRLDKWSFLLTREEYDQYQEGESYGYGFIPAYSVMKGVVVQLVIEDTEIFAAGVRRGDALTMINGENALNFLRNESRGESLGAAKKGVQHTLTFEKDDGSIIEQVFTKALIEEPTVMHENIYETDGKTIGYFMFNTFHQNALDKLFDLFHRFSDYQIDELIIDLRYNGGGSLAVSGAIASYIGGQSVSGSPYATIKTNDKRSQYNTTIDFNDVDIDLGLKRVFFLTSNRTASASEYLINGLKPYIDVVLVGKTTRGKPVGMNPLHFKDYVLFPIMFTGVNANDEGAFYDGISTDHNAYDDTDVAIGSNDDDMVSTALQIIGQSALLPKRSFVNDVPEDLPLLEGFNAYRGFL